MSVSGLRYSFFDLGPDFWKPLINGKDHRFGKWVFDEGLHGGLVEPGFLSSLWKAACFAQQCLRQQLTISFYHQLHGRACAHFRGRDNSTLTTAEHVGRFRHENRRICFIQKYGRLFTPEEEADCKARFSSLTNETGSVVADQETLQNEFLALVDSKIAQLNQDIINLSHDLGTSPIAQVVRREKMNDVKIEYFAPEDKCLVLVEKLFLEFNRKMYQPISREERLRLIAKLFQELEWLHPFPDGQGRTDLLLLNKLLIENGFSPAILEHPFFSTFIRLDGWVAYLTKGMEAWQRELSHPTNPTERECVVMASPTEEMEVEALPDIGQMETDVLF